MEMEGIVLRRKITSELNRWCDSESNECLLVVGARQTGKTYIVERFINERFDSHITLNFHLNKKLTRIFEEDSDVDRLIMAIETAFPGFHAIPGKTALFLDEIQECPEARTSLKAFALDGRYKVIASGSLLGLSYRNTASIPVGYERTMELKSLDFEEYLWALGIGEKTVDYIRGCIHERTPMNQFILKEMMDLFMTYAVVGGMPDAVKTYVSSKDFKEVRTRQKMVVDGYRYDIAKYSEMKDRDKTFMCYDSIPAQLSKDNKKFFFNMVDEIEKYAKYDTYRSSIQWLKDADIVSKCMRLTQPHMPLEAYVSKDSAFKLYTTDTGLLVSMMDEAVSDAIIRGDSRTNKGAIMENLIGECLTKCRHSLYYLDDGSLEIDFITTMRNMVTAIEVKSGNNTRSRSLDSVRNKHGVKRRMKFEKTNIEVDENGIEHYPLFAAAFIDSMYDPVEIRSPIVDVDLINDIASGIARDGE